MEHKTPSTETQVPLQNPNRPLEIFDLSSHGQKKCPPRTSTVSPGLVISSTGTTSGRADLETCSEQQNTPVEAGSVVLVRIGNARNWEDSEKYMSGPGVACSGSEWLAQRGVAAVGVDNVAWDVIGLRDPESGYELPGHLILLIRRGIYIIENLKLDELAAAGHHHFLFVCASLKIRRATGSPVRPLVITYAA